MTISTNVIVSYNVEYFHENKWITVLKHNVDLAEAKNVLNDCYDINPHGEYRIVKH